MNQHIIPIDFDRKHSFRNLCFFWGRIWAITGAFAWAQFRYGRIFRTGASLMRSFNFAPPHRLSHGRINDALLQFRAATSPFARAHH
jgi:hypothetical protein